MPKLKANYHANDPSEIGYRFMCPGCKDYHAIVVYPNTNKEGKYWFWNSSLDSPSINPAIESEGCEVYIMQGKAQFTDRCTHELKGQTVELPEVK